LGFGAQMPAQYKDRPKAVN